MRRGYVIGILLCFFVVGILYTTGFHRMEAGKTRDPQVGIPAEGETEKRTVMAEEAALENSSDPEGITGELSESDSIQEPEILALPARSSSVDTAADLIMPNAGMYYLKEQDGKVWVYLSDRTTLFEKTGIRVEGLPEILRVEIRNGKMLRTEQELYSFLENYSS